MSNPSITSRYTPSENLEILVREAGVKSRSRPEWDAAIDRIEAFARLSDADIAWLAGVRYLGNYIRPYV